MPRMRRFVPSPVVLRWLPLALVVSIAALAAISCGGGDAVTIGVPTSVRDTGLIDALVREFEEENPDVDAVKSVGASSGQLAELARGGKVDVIIANSPEAEVQLIAEDQGIDRRPFMHDSFLVVGPADDPAGVEAATSPAAAFALIARKEAPFISRGDRSSTHVRELAIWEDAGLDPTARSWYQESGADQEASLLMASDEGAYTLVDSATWTVLRDRVEMTRYIVGREVPNVYSVIRVNPEKHTVDEEAALAFADFLTSAAGQTVIERFGRDEYGERLFTPGIPSPS